MRDWQTATLNAHPNIELRLFNAFRARSLLGRGVDFLRRMDIMNQRMHNKLLVADNRAVILGGRNVGNEYFGFGKDFNFRDLDVLGLGPVARQTSTVFDRFWNSEWVVPVAALKLGATTRDLRAESRGILQSLEGTPVLERFPLSHKDWSQRTRATSRRTPTSAAAACSPTCPRPMPFAIACRTAMHDFMSSAKSELLITNSYVIPDDNDIKVFRRAPARAA